DFDPAAAAELLDAAGWIDTDKDGIRDQGPDRQLRLVLLGIERPARRKDSSGPPEKTEREYFVEAARRAGVIIEVQTGGESWVNKRRSEGAYDLIELEWTGRVDMDITPLVAGKDPTRPVQPRVDRALDAISAAWDPAERGRIAEELV